ncbi:DUF2642 domain-containing protein [Sediminibacillus halophilus]|uniref:DUF2642 domain-containing protein n=1 Tax=Sediminibacillus halophilus TaxID=482461 RepID=A0A1G9NVV4_9BACI|nr:DUF2642 domain-containing protein [Sediminibacillus halophilus]SDL90443.1 Protein of unknown function [Sediminibacillus halophilus]
MEERDRSQLKAESEIRDGTPEETPVMLQPIVQPAYINQMPSPTTPVYSVPALPQPTQYMAPFEPVYIDHLSRHQGQQIGVMTTAGKVEGLLSGVAVDHIQLNISKTRAFHIRISQIVYFEGLPITYR